MPTPVLQGAFRHEAEVIRLFTHLRNDCHRHGHTCAEQADIETAPAMAAVTEQPRHILRSVHQQKDVGQEQHAQPDGLSQCLQPADRRNPSRYKRNHHNGTDQIAPYKRNMEGKVQR